MNFQILYYQISGHSVPLKLRRKTTMIAVVLPILSILSVVITHITMADFQIIQVSCSNLFLHNSLEV